MNDNDFEKIITASLEMINRTERTKTKLIETLKSANAALSKTIPGWGNVSFTIKPSEHKLPSIVKTMVSSLYKNDDGSGFIFLEGFSKSEIVASWNILDTTDEISLTIKKTKYTYKSDDNGLNALVAEILSQKDIIEKAVEYKKEFPISSRRMDKKN